MKRKKKIVLSVALVGIVLGVVACQCPSGRVVIVMDGDGQPIAGAMVEPVTLSMNLGEVEADSAGRMCLPSFTVQDIEWVSISAEGYQEESFKVPASWPFEVRLKAE